MDWATLSQPHGETTSIPTPDELVMHLRKAGARRVYLSRTDAFRDGTLPVTATYEYSEDSGRNESPATEREMLTDVFDAIGDQIWVHDRTWALDWQVEPAFTEPQLELLPLYDRQIEQMYGDGFLLQNLFVVYQEAHQYPSDAQNTDP